jgi:putative tricarboxylic transport membrane protein
MAMGFILGPTLEYSFGQSITLSNGELFGYMLFERPITAVILTLTPIVTFLMWRRSNRLRKQFGTEG